jgi:hypothetical protein
VAEKHTVEVDEKPSKFAVQKPRFRFGSVFSKNLCFRFGTVNRHSTSILSSHITAYGPCMAALINLFTIASKKGYAVQISEVLSAVNLTLYLYFRYITHNVMFNVTRVDKLC